MQMQHQRIVPIYIADEVRQSYLDYSMSVIVSRALPDVRDGLKPSQRRILMAMHDLNLEPGRRHRKCAKIAGDTSGNYHPHGEAVIYPTLARMAQDFNMRYTLVDGQGNFGCFTGDTKVKLLDGTDRSFEELARMYGPDEVFYVYSVDHEGNVVVGEGWASRVTRQDAEVIELELDNGEVIRCTPDHRFMLRDGSYKQAQDLTTDDSLMPGYFTTAPVREGLNDYLKIFNPRTETYEFVHYADYRQKMSEALSGIEKRPLSPEEQERVAQIISEKSRAMWRDEAKRAKIVEAIRKAMESPELRAGLSERARALWQDPEYRAKFADDHFSQMSRKFWEQPGVRESHRQKIQKQWEDEDFRAKQRKGVQISNARRLADNPERMHQLAARSAESLRRKWQDEDYKRRVMRSKILCYGSYLLSDLSADEIAPEVFDRMRTNNCFPRFEKARSYFEGSDEFLALSATYNHRIVAKRFLKERFDVYDITVESHHNFLLSSGVFVHNSIDGDPPGAMRYTEARMAPPAVELLADLEKDTVDFVPNYDDTRKEPVVLPGKFPNLICNGCSGIAVGMATNIPPHNLSEVVDALLALIEDPALDCDALMRYISGPDFPTGGIIYGTDGVREAYRTGRGRVVIRARAAIEKLKNGRENIVITEIPFMVTKASLIENIAELVRQKKIEGISDLRDESDREGLRIVIELRRDAYASVILNQLYTRTRLQNSFGVIMLALVDGQPVTLNLKEVLAHFLEHRHRVVVRRTQFELDRAQKRAHIVEGLRVALDHMDRVIALIRKARDRESARESLMAQFGLSEAQVDAILDMRLQRLTGLERGRVKNEYLGLIKEITRLEGILMSRPQRMAIIRSELEALKAKYGDDRRTEIIGSAEEFSIEDLIAEEDMVITISHAGYIKRTPVVTYRRQRRGGRGGMGMTTRDEDFVEHLFIASTHSYILFLTDRGRCYWLKVHEIPEGGRVARGRSVANLLEMSREESIAAIVPVKAFDDEHFLLMATQRGLVKKTVLSEYGRPRRDGIIAVDILPEDRLIEARLTDGMQDVILATRRGQSIRFRESDVRPMGRATRGVTGISLRDGDEVVSMVVVRRQGSLIMVCRNGYGKRTPVQDYPVIRRGGKGVIGIKTSERNGELVSVKEVVDSDELMIISQGGILIRLPIKDVSVIGRNTQGVRLIQLDPEDVVVDVAYIVTDGAQEADTHPSGKSEEEEVKVGEEAGTHHAEAVSDEAADVASLTDASETDDENGGSPGLLLDLFETGSSEDEGKP